MLARVSQPRKFNNNSQIKTEQFGFFILRQSKKKKNFTTSETIRKT